MQYLYTFWLYTPLWAYGIQDTIVYLRSAQSESKLNQFQLFNEKALTQPETDGGRGQDIRGTHILQ